MKERTLARFLLALLVIAVAECEVYQHTHGWCETGSDGEFKMYDMKEQSCLECGGKRSFQQRDEMNSLRCCINGEVKKKCSQNELPCEDGGYFSKYQICDGKKDCVNGKDEMNCTKECDRFPCHNYKTKGNTTNEQCIPYKGVCDGVKDCISGFDESSCIYYEGRCDGFLCGSFPQCVPLEYVCDNVKNCLDGTDEVMCDHFTKVDSFECESIEGIIEQVALIDICDGENDCGSGEDKNMCFMWMEWSAWSECECKEGKSSQRTDERTRTCATLRWTVQSKGKCPGFNIEERNTTCTCPPATDTPAEESRALVYIIIAVTLLLVIAVGMLVLNTVMRQKRAWLSYTQAAVSFQNPTSESLPLSSGGNEAHNGTLPQLYSERRLPATPPGQICQIHNSANVRFSNRTQHQASILDPQENTAYKQNVENPLYHTFTGSRLEFRSNGDENQSLPNLATVAYESCENLRSGTPSGVSDNDVFYNDDDNHAAPNLMEQIEIAQMGNLIEVSDIKIN